MCWGAILLLATQGDGAWTSLFNGKDLAGWEQVGAGTWTIEGDRLVCSGGKSGWLSTAERYGDFELELEAKVGPGGNSGIFLRSPRLGLPWEAGMEIQILDDAGHKNIKPWQHTGSLYGVAPPAKPVYKPAGEWNRFRVVCRGPKVEVHLNGEKIVDADMDAEEKLKARPRRGFVGLQNHGTAVEFRNVRIRATAPAVPLRFLVPAYFDPRGAAGLKHWDRLIATAHLAPVVAIANPASGPGAEADATYVKTLARARQAGIRLVGYVTTSYAKRPLEEVKADVDRWIRFYPMIEGIFFDEQASGPEHVDYQTALYAYVRKERKLGLSVTNPGTACDEKYLSHPAADAACIFEHHTGWAGYKPPPWSEKYGRERFAVLPYNIPPEELQAVAREALERRSGWLYVTDAAGENPWNRLPTYWEEEVAYIHELSMGKR